MIQVDPLFLLNPNSQFITTAWILGQLKTVLLSLFSKTGDSANYYVVGLKRFR